MITNIKAHLVAGLFWLLPHHLISRITLRLTRSEILWLRNLLVSAYTWKFPLKMEEALEPSVSAYRSLNALFTRALRPEARPIASGPCLISPADGKISEFGSIQHDSLLQAKVFITISIACSADSPILHWPSMTVILRRFISRHAITTACTCPTRDNSQICSIFPAACSACLRPRPGQRRKFSLETSV